MKISYNWLQSYFGKSPAERGKLPSPEKLAEVLTMRAFEIESVEKQGAGLDNVVVGEVLKKEKHPNADRLSLVKIDVGEKHGGILEIVCGAPNIDAGQKVVVALVGAVLPGDFKIEKREVRGIVSNGMCCSERELGLADESNGILVLDKKANVGTPIVEFLNKSQDSRLNTQDFLLDIKVLPNRAHDCLSYEGMAKEVSAILGLKLVGNSPFSIPVIKGKDSKRLNSRLALSIKVDEPKLCKRYIGRIIEGVKVGPSPKWLKERLESIGQRSINNIVDATNFVMFDIGQPSHAFDLDKINANDAKSYANHAKEIFVRNAKPGEKIETIDGQVRELDANILVIADAEGPIAIAGVMGGKRTMVDENTKNIILESANFEATNIRKTSKKLGLRTESSVRFENGITAELAEKGMNMLTEIISEFESDKNQSMKVGAPKDFYPKKESKRSVSVKISDFEKLLGVKIKEKEIIDILKRLNFGVIKKSRLIGSGQGSLVIIPPPERLDIERKEDVIEEVGRIYGYEKIQAVMPEDMLVPPVRNESIFYADLVRGVLVGAGYSEVYNYSYAKNGEVEIANPVDKNKKFLKTNLLDDLKENLKINARNFKDVKIFEIGTTFQKNNEMKSLAGVSSGANFFESKGIVEKILEACGITEFYFEENKDGTADIRVGNSDIGVVGHGSFEINFDLLVRLTSEEREFAPISKYPAVKRDISLFVPMETKVDAVMDVIENSGGELLFDTDLFDIFEMPARPASDSVAGVDANDKKSLAFHLVFQSYEKTLSENEINEVMNKIMDSLDAQEGWEVRRV